MSLYDVLREKNSVRTSRQKRPSDYSVKEMYKISLTLAYAVLQVYRTPWLQTLWTKNKLFFISDTMTLLDNLYVSQATTPHQEGHQNQASSEPRPWSDPTIHGLGILLLELAFGCPLEAIPADPRDLGGEGTPVRSLIIGEHFG